MVSKTRDKLIEVARLLFARKGVDNTTMNDIAEASEKGRRTIYTYFKNKRDIYNAVVERESEALLEVLRHAVSSETDPGMKLRRFLEARFDLFNKSFGTRRDSIMALFGRDNRRVERIHRLLFLKERSLIDEIIEAGISAGEFDPHATKDLPALCTMVFKGVDFAQFRDNFDDTGFTEMRIRNSITDFIAEAVSVKE